MQIPEGRRYSEHHIWVLQEEKGLRLGLTVWGCEYLGSVGYVELSPVGKAVAKDTPFGWAETGKAVTELFAPVSGTVVEINEELEEAPYTITDDPYGRGWLVVFEPDDPKDLEQLMSTEEYAKLASERA